MQTEVRVSKTRVTREAGARLRFQSQQVEKQEQMVIRRKYEVS